MSRNKHMSARPNRLITTLLQFNVRRTSSGATRPPVERVLNKIAAHRRSSRLRLRLRCLRLLLLHSFTHRHHLHALGVLLDLDLVLDNAQDLSGIVVRPPTRSAECLQCFVFVSPYTVLAHCTSIKDIDSQTISHRPLRMGCLAPLAASETLDQPWRAAPPWDVA